MKIRTFSLQLLSAAFVLMALACCTHRQESPVSAVDGYNEADSLVSAIGDERDYPRLLTVADSLERAGELSKVKSIFYCTIAYNLTGEHRKALQLYYQLADIDVSQFTSGADVECYIYSYKDYVRLLCDMRRYDRALREAYHADRQLKAAGHPSFADHQDIAQIIGECQLYLGQESEAAKNFHKSLQAVHARLAVNNDPLDLRECQKTMNAIAKTLIYQHRYNDAAPWIARQDSLYRLAATHPHSDSVYTDEMKAEISYSKALLAHAEGRVADAEQAFADYLSTREARRLSSVINSSEYLMLTRRYAEAARNYERLGQFMQESALEADLENIGRYLLPKFRANLLAGQRDTALTVATQVAAAYDSALIRQKLNDADLLTTVYDTEGKERQIAEQRAKLSQQRLFTVAIVMVILIIFFLTYTVQRSRAFHRLNATNRQLTLANERAEESSRMKTKFIQQISHEVRTPLNILSGFTQVLASPDLEVGSSELQTISSKIIENSERITSLIDNMLDLSELYSNTNIPTTDTVSPADIARQAADQSGIRQAPHVVFTLDVQSTAAAVTFVTNRKAAVKSLTLLLDNAVKFTRPQTDARVTLSVSAVGQQLQFVVEDTGIGIPPEQAEHIFTEFVQLNDYVDGTGIGLTIARSVCRHMGGDVTLDTTYTSGARFVMTLPTT
jgi:signal transduction histidine kinase